MKILMAECMQEISSFNPLPSRYENFTVKRGEELLTQRGYNTMIGGALSVFDRRADVLLVPTFSAGASSAGTLEAAGWLQLSADFLAAVRPYAGKVDALYISLHGAMGAENESDPEGYLLQEVRSMFGADIPIVISMDLHGIVTDRMLRHIDGLTVFRTYPHVDFADTGARAAKLLLDIIDRGLRPVISRVVVPLLARGDECITKSGVFGDVLQQAVLMERRGDALAAGVWIGNPFTDVPELCTQAIVVTESDTDVAASSALTLAEAMWTNRHRLAGKLISPERAMEIAKVLDGPVIFTDAADATSSGASGDSNAILRTLVEGGYNKRVLCPIVDPAAAAAAHAAGVGATIEVTLGGAHDKRFQPLPVTACVESLSRGRAYLETSRGLINSGPTAVLTFDSFTVVVMSRAASLYDRAIFYANGLDPRYFDLIVVKSPHCEHHMYDAWAEKNFNVDAPGSTSANVVSLGHTRCMRPMYPIELDTSFQPKIAIYRRRDL